MLIFFPAFPSVLLLPSMATDSVQLQWSARFGVSTSYRSTSLPGDKIILPPSALEQLLAASNKLADSQEEPAPRFDPFNSSGFATHRRIESQYLDRQQQLPQPLTFRLVNPHNGHIVYAGIQEFSAEDGEVVLSSFLKNALGLGSDRETTDGERVKTGEEVSEKAIEITIHARQLAKGKFVKLRPLEPGYDPDDWKALLEQHLRSNFTTLTNGEVLVIPGGRGIGKNKEEFRFLVDGFQPEADAICIVDTDLEVDIEALNEEQARETLRRISERIRQAPGTEAGSSKGGDLDIFKEQSGQVLPGEYVDYQLPSWPRDQSIQFELEGVSDEDEVDLLVSTYSARQRERPRLEDHIFADWSGRPAKRIRLDPTNIELKGAEALWVSVHAFSGNDDDPERSDIARRYTLRAKTADSEVPSVNKEDINEQPPNPGEIKCKNCRQWIPERTMMLHENFCLRNNILCPKGCGQIFQKRSEDFSKHWHCPHDTFYGNSQSSKAKHDSLYHPSDSLSCTRCSTVQSFTSLPLLAHHHVTTCPAKVILCRFCHLEVAQEGDPDEPNAEALLYGLTPHELADGSRTTECHLCNKITRLRDMDTHLKHHNLERKSRPRPRLCRNVNCGRTLDRVSSNGDTRAGTRMGQGPGNDVGLCSSCYGPLYVSMHDPEGKALKRRIERRYLQQLLSGCGKAWCKNDFCKTGRKNSELPEAGISTKDALPLSKPFVDASVKDTASPLHFCVDDQSQKRKELALMLAAEYDTQFGQQGYDTAWCVGALEAEKGSLEKAKQWLTGWAPRKDEERIS